MTNKQKNIEPFIMTLEDSLEIINEFLKENKKGKKFKAAVMMAQKALKNEIGRARRFETDLENAESDYARDFAAEQDLYGEDSDSFLGKVKADGFDIMDAFHDGAEWQAERGITTKGKLSSFGGSTCFFVPSDVTKQIYHDGVDRYKDVKLQIIKD